LDSLVSRYNRPATTILKARIYDAVRAGTAINCPVFIREAALTALEAFPSDDAVAIVDSICTADHNLPILTTEFSEEGWERPISALMVKGKTSLERLIAGYGN
jgi:hypothetical protein